MGSPPITQQQRDEQQEEVLEPCACTCCAAVCRWSLRYRAWRIEEEQKRKVRDTCRHNIYPFLAFPVTRRSDSSWLLIKEQAATRASQGLLCLNTWLLSSLQNVHTEGHQRSRQPHLDTWNVQPPSSHIRCNQQRDLQAIMPCTEGSYTYLSLCKRERLRPFLVRASWSKKSDHPDDWTILVASNLYSAHETRNIQIVKCLKHNDKLLAHPFHAGCTAAFRSAFNSLHLNVVRLTLPDLKPSTAAVRCTWLMSPWMAAACAASQPIKQILN
eukprot:1161479-Pelagomonas_calceolata.AAC.13